MFRHFLMAVALAVTVPVASAGDVEVALDLYHFAGNLSVEQRDALLASPDWKVQASYSPLASVPGITASWSKCGFLSLPCLRDDGEDIILTGSAIRRQGTELRFSLPRYVGVRRFRLAYVSVSLQLPEQRGQSNLLTYFYINRKDGVKTSPVVLQAGTFLLAGTLSVQGESFQARYDCSDLLDCSAKADNGRYGFPARHRFSFYRQGYLFPDPAQSLGPPLPAELAEMKIYRAVLHTRQEDGHRIDFVDIAATENRDGCSSDDLQYEILYVDGAVIAFSRRMPDPDPAQCRGHYQHIEWGNDGKPLAFGGMQVDWINHGSSVTYFNWRDNCLSVSEGNHNKCNIPPPTAIQEAEIRAEAKRVREWFFLD